MLFPAVSFSASGVSGLFIGLHGLAFFICLATLVWLVCSVFLYKTWFDFAFKQEVSQNVYGEVLPADGKYDYTIMLSAHTDTSWNWKHSAATAMFFSELDLVTKFGLSALMSDSMANMTEDELMRIVELAAGLSDLSVALYILIPLFVIPGCFLITLWADKNPRTASPGAMDNATGIGIAYAATKYFKENPDKLPAGCRIIDFNCGSEEAGLRGSIAFTRRHKGEDILKNCWNINIDSIADKDHFQVVHGDTWQFTRFDADLERMLAEAMRDAGIENPGNIANPVGGCDSTPFTKAGVKSITFAAQNPILTYYYHTFYDQPERFEKETVGLGLDVVLRLVDKIAAFRAGSAPVQESAAPAEAAPAEEAPVEAEVISAPADAEFVEAEVVAEDVPEKE